jgi:hypothetical protein
MSPEPRNVAPTGAAPAAAVVLRCPSCEDSASLAVIERAELRVRMRRITVAEDGTVRQVPGGTIDTLHDTASPIALACRACDWWDDLQTDGDPALESVIRQLAAAQQQRDADEPAGGWS